MTPSHTDGRCATIVHFGGYDGTAEEVCASVSAALDRGSGVAALDGPGEGAVLYDRRVPMRSDGEDVVPALFDAVTARPEVDPERVVLVGRPFDGLVAPRGAAGEHRLAAMVVDPGQYDCSGALSTAVAFLRKRRDQIPLSWRGSLRADVAVRRIRRRRTRCPRGRRGSPT